MLVPLRGDCDCYLLCYLLFVRFPRPNTGNLQTGDSFTSEHHAANNAVAQTIQTPVPARTSPTYSNVPREPNRRPYTTERPLSLKTRGAEPPSLYDGTSTFTQIAKHNTRNCSSTCSLFVNTVHHTRTIAYVPNRAKCSLRSRWTLNR